MYATCLFCNASLGANEAIEHFPVGRRLAYDAAAGRLWVVCKQCGRWNLSPLETRWEAIEEAERMFRQTKTRVSTDNIALAELRDGTELVRIGAPPRLELSVWRYGREMTNRWWYNLRPDMIASAAWTLANGFLAGRLIPSGNVALFCGATMAGTFTTQATLRAYLRWYRQTVPVLSVHDSTGELLRLSQTNIDQSMLVNGAAAHDWSLHLPHVTTKRAGPIVRLLGSREQVRDVQMPAQLTGASATRVLSQILPRINKDGAVKGEIESALNIIDGAADVASIMQQVSVSIASRKNRFAPEERGQTSIVRAPKAARLALEMAMHEHDEQRAMQGELKELEQRWRDADAIAKIADEMFLPDTVNDTLLKLRDAENEAGPNE